MRNRNYYNNDYDIITIPHQCTSLKVKELSQRTTDDGTQKLSVIKTHNAIVKLILVLHETLSNYCLPKGECRGDNARYNGY